LKLFYKIFLAFVLIIIVFLIINHQQNELEYSEQNIEISPLPQKIKSTIKLYFVKDTQLAEEFRTVVTNNLQFEISVVEELIKGPRNKLLKPTIPNNTKIISVKTIDNVCYINLSKEYIHNELWNQMDSALIIWSLVNSLTELDYIHKVQILVEGEKVKPAYSEYSFEEPFISNKELIEKKATTPYSIVIDFLDNIRNERSDKSYSMLAKVSMENISFEEFRVGMEKYIRRIQSYTVKFYNTQKFSDYIRVIITYNLNSNIETNDEVIYEEWKLIVEDGEWKILLENKIP